MILSASSSLWAGAAKKFHTDPIFTAVRQVLEKLRDPISGFIHLLRFESLLGILAPIQLFS